jgi:thiamine biosynthesis lipoprotein
MEIVRVGRTVRFTRPGVSLDLGAVGKGFALDAASRILRDAGVTCTLVHGGTSSAVAIGAPPGEPGWRIAIRDEGEPGPVVLLRDASLSVSAPRGRMIQTSGGRIGHIIDPRTGRPAPAARIAAVIADSATLADAWSTAVLVEGRRPVGMPQNMTTIIRAENGSWAIRGPLQNSIIQAPLDRRAHEPAA